MSTHNTGANRPAGKHPATLAAAVFGIVFLLVGILGFIPGVTTDYDTMQFAGHESEAMLFGVFQVSILHNIVHLLFGVAGLALAKNPLMASNYLIGSGVIYGVLTLYGLFIGHDSQANFVPLNTADNWLHVVLTVALIGAGIATRPRGSDATTTR